MSAFFQTTQSIKIETLYLISLILSITDCPLARMDKEVPSYEPGSAQGFSLLKGGVFATVFLGVGPWIFVKRPERLIATGTI